MRKFFIALCSLVVLMAVLLLVPIFAPSTTSFITSATSASAGPFEIIGSPELVFDWTTDRCENYDIPDLPARAFRDINGKVQLLAAHFENYRFIGNSLDTVKKDCSNGKIYNSANDPNYDNHKNHEWVASPYTMDGQNIYALVHNEWYAYLTDGKCNPNDRVDGWVNSLTLVKSTDGGMHYSHPIDYKVWTHPVQWNASFTCGPRTLQNPSNYTRYGAFAPSNTIKKGNHYYAMYRSGADPTNYTENGSCLIRTADVTSGASSWEVWTGSGWNSSVTAKCSPVNRQIGVPRSLTYNTYLNSYILLGNQWDATGTITGVFYSLSPDLFDWTSPIQILSGSNFLYPSLLDPTDTSRNFENTGQEAYVYFTAYANGTRTGLDRDLMRQKIKFLPEAIPTPPINSFWSMDEASWNGAAGEVLDSSGNNNPATASCTGSGCSLPVTTVGKVTKGGRFDGVDDYLVSAKNVFDPSYTDFTAAIWFKPNSVGTSKVFLSQQDGTGTGRSWLFQSATGFLQSNIVGTGLTGTTPILANTWQHAAVVKQGSKITLYLNGNQEGQTTGTILSATGNTIIGAAKTTTSGFFSGTLDEAKIYSRALTGAEILALATAGGTPPPSTARVSLMRPSQYQGVSGPSVVILYTKENTIGSEHLHLQLDNQPEIRDTNFTGSYTFPNVTNGRHTITGYLARNNDHTKITGTDISTTTFIVNSVVISIGDRVRVIEEVNVRTTPSLTGTILGTQPISAQGTVLGGSPGVVYTWWQINYDTGSDGWSVQNNLIKPSS